MTEIFRCADASRARAESPLGSALPSQAWLLLEYTGAWAYDAWPGLCDDDDVAATVKTWRMESLGRVQLLRRPDRKGSRGEPPYRWKYCGPTGTWHGLWTSVAEIGSIIESVNVGRVPEHALPGFGDPIIAVCAHSKHDVCCAVRGRSVASLLAEEWPDMVWETSHLGGDRFAGNALILPHGIMLGHLDDDNAVAAVRGALEGRPVPDTFRGTTSFSPAEQAAVAYAIEDNPSATLRDITVDGSRESDDGVSTVTLQVAGTAHEYAVRVTKSEPQRNSCAHDRTAAVNIVGRA